MSCDALPSTIGQAAAFAAARSQSQVAQAVGIKVLKMVNQQQAAVAGLIEAAVQSAEQIAAAGHVDVHA